MSVIEFLIIGMDIFDVDFDFLCWFDYDDLTISAYNYKLAIDMLITDEFPLI